MGFFRKQLLNVIEWTSDSDDELMVYRFPVDGKEIKNGAQLTVRESQVAIFVNEGQIADVFMPGRYKLTTANLPVLTKLQSWKYDFNSPFKAEVYFVNTKQFQGKKWGTANPFALRDAEFGVVRIRAFGTYSIQVVDAKTFLKEVFGTTNKYYVSSILEYAKSIVVCTKSGRTALMVSRFRPIMPIVAFVTNKKAYHQLSMSWNVQPYLTEEYYSTEELSIRAIDRAKEMPFIRKDDVIIIVAGIARQVNGTNLMRIEKVR